MKKAFRKLMISFILVLMFPLIINLILRAMIFISDRIGVSILMRINNISDIDFSDYMMAIAALLSFTGTLWIGYFTYQLTQSIQNYKESQDKYVQRNSAILILQEIENNIQIMRRKAMLLESEPQKIQLYAQSQIKDLAPALSTSVNKYLTTLYDYFYKFKNENEISQQEMEHWFKNENCSEIKEVKTDLERIGGISQNVSN